MNHKILAYLLTWDLFAFIYLIIQYDWHLMVLMIMGASVWLLIESFRENNKYSKL